MFNFSKLIEEKSEELKIYLEKRFLDLSTKLSSTATADMNSKLANFNLEMNNKVERLKVDIDKRLVEFHKEITDKYFKGLENITRQMREISLIETLASQMKSEDLQKLETALMQPVLSQQWEKEKQEEIDKADKTIKSSGQKLINLKNKLHNEYLVLNRSKQDTQAIEISLKVIDEILKG